MADNKEYKISIDARILELLGPSLYTNIYFILAELIANAYDANAKNVYIIQKEDSLTIEDDGHGMSYNDGDVQKYLNVAKETRTEETGAFVRGSDETRRKMGRKGVGKLAALSVSVNVEIKTIKDGEKSGFVLSRHVKDDRLLTAISEDKIKFEKIKNNGTSVVMRDPQYKLHKTMQAIRNNLLKIFPFVDSEFKIHIEVGKNHIIIDSFEKEIIQGLGGLITIGDEYKGLSKHFDSQLNKKSNQEKELIKSLPSYKKNIRLKRQKGAEETFELEVKGWIGVYRSTKGRKADPSDFPDNFISLLSNKKLGEYNILPTVGKNSISEAYIVGQLHVELFEDSRLPDMALSNRQGYKTDDERYKEVISYVRKELLPKAISLRTKYAAYVNQEKEEERNKKNIEREKEFRIQIESFKENASTSAAESISSNFSVEGVDQKDLKAFVAKAINKNLPAMGIKSTINANKKKLLISHSGNDKPACDFIFKLLTFNGIPAGDIIYTSSDDPACIVPRNTSIFDYLRDFFVESYSTQKIHVIYVTSDSMGKSWAAVSEVGAGWISKSKHDIFNINDHMPKKPLDTEVAWANILHKPNGISLSLHEANRVVEKIEGVTLDLNYNSKPKQLIMQELKRLAEVFN